MQEKIVLIGAGSAMFTRGLIADLIDSRMKVELALVDIDPKALQVAYGVARKMIVQQNAPITLAASTDRREVLRDATVVICTIGVGGRRAWEQDVFIPRKYGIYVPVGDTVGPGGSSRALRMIPAMIDIARDVLDLAPQALFFNYGNPMAPICRAVHKATGAPVVGLCHGVMHVARFLADALRVPTEQLQYTAVGYNHLTWFTAIRAHGKDAIPLLRDYARQHLEQTQAVFANATDEEKRQPFGPDHNPFSWELFQLFGAFPAVLDRHVAEFFPQFFRSGAYYGRTLGIDAFSFEGVIAFGDDEFAELTRISHIDGALPSEFLSRGEGEHEQVLAIVNSIRQDQGRLYSANLPNTGQVPNLPHNVIIESPCVATVHGLRAVVVPELPAALAGALATRYAWAETIVEAALEGSRDKFIQALVLDGYVESLGIASTLADELLEAQASYLPQFRREATHA
jgi:alpha-galactosidase